MKYDSPTNNNSMVLELYMAVRVRPNSNTNTYKVDLLLDDGPLAGPLPGTGSVQAGGRPDLHDDRAAAPHRPSARVTGEKDKGAGVSRII